jgi:uncharacterized protein YjbJ (UPF0337 family)
MSLAFSSYGRIKSMDKDRVFGFAKQIKGTIKRVTGKIVGDVKLESEGSIDNAGGKIQNAVGGFKDTVKDAFKRK